MIPLTNHDFQWGRSEVVIIYPDPSPVPGAYARRGIEAMRREVAAVHVGSIHSFWRIWDGSLHKFRRFDGDL